MNRRNHLALAQTIPDGEPVRDSFVRIRTGAPLSSDLERIGEDLLVFSGDVAAGMSQERIYARMEMLARRLTSLINAAQALEHHCERLTEVMGGRNV